MSLSGQWFIAQAISSIRHRIGSGLAFELARRAKASIRRGKALSGARPKPAAIAHSIQGATT